MDIIIRRAKVEDALFLTSISFGAKRYWSYSSEYLVGDNEDLTITEEYLNENIVFVAQKKDTIIGYCSLHEVKEAYTISEDVIEAGYWLEHIFIRPAYIKNGIGRRLIEQVKAYCGENNIVGFKALSHPLTNGFYEKMGAEYVKDMGAGEIGQEVCLFELIMSNTLETENIDTLSQVEEGEYVSTGEAVEESEYVSTEEAREENEKTDEMTDEVESIQIEAIEESVQENIKEQQLEEEFDLLAEIEKITSGSSVNHTTEDDFNETEVSVETKGNLLEQDTLSYKLFELDKDLDEDEIDEEETDEESELYFIEDETYNADGLYELENIHYESNESDDLLNEGTCDEEDNHDEALQKLNESSEDRTHEEILTSRLSYEAFLNSTVPIGYKFECQEEAELLAKQKEEEVHETKMERLSIEELEMLLSSVEIDEKEEAEDHKETDIAETKDTQIVLEEIDDGEELFTIKNVENADDTNEPLISEKEVQVNTESVAYEEQEEAVSDEVLGNIEEVVSNDDSLEEAEEDILDEMDYASKELVAACEEIQEDEIDNETESKIEDNIQNDSLEPEHIPSIVNKSQEHKMIDISNQINEKSAEHIQTEKDKMLAGEMYIAWGDEIVEDRKRARKLLKEFNNADSEDKRLTHTILTQLFGKVGEYIHIEPSFKCSYGYNIEVGDNFYAGCNLVIVDNARVKIGDNCIISPQVGIYTLAYPLNVDKRIAGYEYAQPVIIGDNVWIGGGTTINPGVTIGNNVVISPGSVVVSDIPDGVLVGGNPAKIIRNITE